MATAVKKIDENQKSKVEYFNLLSVINTIDIKHLTDVQKTDFSNKLDLSKVYYEQNDLDKAYLILELELNHFLKKDEKLTHKTLLNKIDSFFAKENNRTQKILVWIALTTFFSVGFSSLFTPKNYHNAVSTNPVERVVQKNDSNDNNKNSVDSIPTDVNKQVLPPLNLPPPTLSESQKVDLEKFNEIESIISEKNNDISAEEIAKINERLQSYEKNVNSIKEAQKISETLPSIQAK